MEVAIIFFSLGLSVGGYPVIEFLILNFVPLSLSPFVPFFFLPPL